MDDVECAVMYIKKDIGRLGFQVQSRRPCQRLLSEVGGTALSLLDSDSGLGCEIIRGHLKGSYGWAWLRLADCSRPRQSM